MSLDGYWRPPWETTTAVRAANRGAGNGGFYGGRGGGQRIDHHHHHRADHPRASGKQTEQQQHQQRHRKPEEYYYGGNERRTPRWDDDGYGDDSKENPFDANYPPPTNHPPRASQRDLYFNDRLGCHHQDRYYERGRAHSADVAYGVGLPVGGDASPPPLTTTDDGSSDSLRYVGGRLDDAVDGYARQYRRNTESPSTLSRGVDSLYPDDVVESPPPAPMRSMIEILPGVKMLLRGADETWEAYQRKFYAAVTCIGCSAKVFCIRDADYVLCPVCRVVSPLEISEKPSPHRRRIGGVGLGFQSERDYVSSPLQHRKK